jgi:hypothetical protein
MVNNCYYIPGKDVDYELVKDINKKIKRINSHQEYSNTLRNRIIKTLTEEANAHSFAMELLNSEILNGGHYSCLNAAWDWAEKNYDGQFSHNFIIELAGRIEPLLNHGPTILDKGLDYRKGSVRLTGKNPPHIISPQKVPEEMERLIYFLNNSSENPLVRSIFGHMHFIRNHPFYDGNGRTARMIQNLILNYNNFPPIKIERGERDFYQMMIGNALGELENRLSIDSHNPNNDIRLFFEYLTSIENITLDRMEDELKKKRQYGIYVDAKQKQKLFTAESILKNAIDRTKKGKGISVHLNKDKGMIIIKGDVSWKEIEPTIDCLKRKRISCNLVSIV